MAYTDELNVQSMARISIYELIHSSENDRQTIPNAVLTSPSELAKIYRLKQDRSFSFLSVEVALWQDFLGLAFLPPLLDSGSGPGK